MNPWDCMYRSPQQMMPVFCKGRTNTGGGEEAIETLEESVRCTVLKEKGMHQVSQRGQKHEAGITV